MAFCIIQMKGVMFISISFLMSHIIIIIENNDYQWYLVLKRLVNTYPKSNKEVDNILLL